MGSSGDLVPLAHLALVLIGEGEAVVAAERLPGAEALRRAGLEPVVLSAKEGLALINGTHLMAAAGALAVRDAQRLVEAAIVAAALSLEAFKGSTVPFDERLHELRDHPGPVRVAARLRALLAGSDVVASHADCGRVQDPYTLRCVPQVIGAVDDALALRRPAPSGASSKRSPTTRWSSRRRTASRARCCREATSTASRCRCRSITSRSRSASWPPSASGACTPSCRRATRACRLPITAPGPGLGADDRPVRGGRPRERMPGALAPGRRRARSPPRRAPRTSTRWAPSPRSRHARWWRARAR